MKRIALSGGFDPLHPGLIALIKDASQHGEVHILLNSDTWLIRKKGFFFQSWDARKKILEVYTPYIHMVDDADGSVREGLRRIHPDLFGKGGDWETDMLPEYEVCRELGIKILSGLGGDAYISGTELKVKQRVTTRWGHYDVMLAMPHLKVKLLHIDAGQTLSLQKHQQRSEFFFMPNGEVRMNLPGVWHILTAPREHGLDVLEVQMGISDESDIERVHETHESFKAEKAKNIHLNI